MKNLVKILSLSAIALLPFAAEAANKILVVDLNKVLAEYHKVKDAQTKLQDSYKNAQKEVEIMVSERQQMVTTFNEAKARFNNPALSEDAREKAKAEATDLQQKIQKKEGDMNQYRQRMASTLEQRRRNILSIHLEDIRAVMNKLADKHSADFILNKNEVLFAKPDYEITSDVLEILNADAPPAVEAN